MTVQQPANLTWQLYRMLLRRARQMEQQKTSFCLRQPPFGRFENATRALADDHLHQHIFEGIIDRWGLRGALDVPAMPLTGCSLLQCIRSAFRHPRTVTQQQILQQCTDALRTITLQQRMATLSSRTVTDGILVDITTRYARVQPPGETEEHDFEYNIRVVNMRPDAVKLIARHWQFYNASEVLVTAVEKWARGIVGHEPILPPNHGVQYSSWAKLPFTEGFMEGAFLLQSMASRQGGAHVGEEGPAPKAEVAMIEAVVAPAHFDWSIAL